MVDLSRVFFFPIFCHFSIFILFFNCNFRMIDDMFQDDAIDEESNALVEGVFADIGLEVSWKLKSILKKDTILTFLHSCVLLTTKKKIQLEGKLPSAGKSTPAGKQRVSQDVSDDLVKQLAGL